MARVILRKPLSAGCKFLPLLIQGAGMQRDVNIDVCQDVLNQRLMQLDQLRTPSTTRPKKTTRTNKTADGIEPEQCSVLTYYALHERRLIERALTRINQGNYGWCKDCGRHIGADRLEFEPSTELCTYCINDRDR